MTALSRRSLFTRTGAAIAVLSIPIPLPALAQAPAPAARAPMSFLRIRADGTVAFVLPTAEMGQGTHTGQAQILAEELGADWTRIAVEMPTRIAPEYRISLFRQMRSVGSYGIRYWHDPLRLAAAQAREMLIQAAAARLSVAPDTLRAENSRIVHAASGRSLGFGELAADAARLPVPEQPALRPASERALTGRAVTRVDTPAKIAGKAVYAADVTLPGMLHGAVRLAPVFSADVEAFDPASVAGMPGVVAVARVPKGAVVVARSWWEAKKAADALAIRFTATQDDGLTTAEIDRRLRAGLSATNVPVSLARGDADGAFARAARIVEADYAVPFLAHACMEPIVGTARAQGEDVELWLGTQGHDEVRMGLERALQIPNERLTIHTTYLGGGFGRKTSAEIAIQAILASRAAGGRPVKVQWAREDDIAQGEYRQTMMARFRAALDAQGRIAGMTIRVSGPQMGRTLGIPIGENNIDPFSLNGIVDMRYQIADLRIDHAVVPLPIRMRPWRSIANSFTGFFVESFMDECARAAGADPIAFRRAHLQGQTRMLAVLDRVETMSNWRAPAPAGTHRGVAVTDCYGSPVAEVVEISMAQGRLRVGRVHVAIDCGRAVNPGQVEAQLQGSVVDALSAALRGKITVADGRAEQSNFHDYPLLRIDETPDVRTAILDIGSPLGGVGEPAVPPLAPALANAIASANGTRVRSLPFADHGLA
ncbi:MAG: molybdopterin cofactor-binding domain-containing protein [Tagaea sp.]